MYSNTLLPIFIFLLEQHHISFILCVIFICRFLYSSMKCLSSNIGLHNTYKSEPEISYINSSCHNGIIKRFPFLLNLYTLHSNKSSIVGFKIMRSSSLVFLSMNDFIFSMMELSIYLNNVSLFVITLYNSIIIDLSIFSIMSIIFFSQL